MATTMFITITQKPNLRKSPRPPPSLFGRYDGIWDDDVAHDPQGKARVVYANGDRYEGGYYFGIFITVFWFMREQVV